MSTSPLATISVEPTSSIYELEVDDEISFLKHEPSVAVSSITTTRLPFQAVVIDENASPNRSSDASTPRKRSKTPLIKSVKKAMKSLFTPSKNTSLPLMTLQDNTNRTKSASSSPVSEVSLGIAPSTYTSIGNTCTSAASTSPVPLPSQPASTECVEVISTMKVNTEASEDDSLQYSSSTTNMTPDQQSIESPIASPVCNNRRTSLLLTATYSSYYTPVYMSSVVDAIVAKISEYKNTNTNLPDIDIESIITESEQINSSTECPTVSRAELDTMIEKLFLAPVEVKPMSEEVLESNSHVMDNAVTASAASPCAPAAPTESCDTICSLKKQLQEAHAALFHSTITITALEQKLSDLQANSVPTASLDKLYTTISTELEGTYASKLAAMEKELSATKQKLSQAEVELSNVPQQIASATAAAKSAVYEKAKQQFEEGNKKYAAVKQQLKDCQTMLSQESEKVSAQDTTIVTLQNQLSSLQEELTVQKDERLKYETALLSICEAVGLAIDKITPATIPCILEQISTNATTISTQLSAISSLSAELETVKAASQVLQQKADSMETELSAAREMRETAENEKEAQMQVLARLITSKGKLESELASVQAALEEQTTRANGLRDMNAELMGMLEKAYGESAN